MGSPDREMLMADDGLDMADCVAYVDDRDGSNSGSRSAFHEAKVRLDDWASWARRDRMPLGFPRTNGIWRCMKYGANGAAIPKGVVGLTPREVPPDVEEVEIQLENLARISDAVYYIAVVLSHLEKKPDKAIAADIGISKAELRRRRTIGYAWLDGRLNN